MNKNVENQERCFYKLTHITVTKCQSAKPGISLMLSILSNEAVGACGRGTHQEKS